jgi:hypothetical protein
MILNKRAHKKQQYPKKGEHIRRKRLKIVEVERRDRSSRKK